MVTRRKPNLLVFLVAALVVIATGWWQQRSGEAKAPAGTATANAGPKASPVPPAQATPTVDDASARADGPALESVPAAEREGVIETLARIDGGGPFPHRQDGSVFQNREGRLPQRPHGYYREYTVPTRGASNRGARRLVVGSDGDTWYTSDHYRTLVRIDE